MIRRLAGSLCVFDSKRLFQSCFDSHVLRIAQDRENPGSNDTDNAWSGPCFAWLLEISAGIREEALAK